MNDSILATENLTKDFDGFKAINNLNFSMAPGELRVVIGPNGAGKTTFLDLITGKTKPTTGQVLFKGKNVRRYSEDQISRLGIGRKFQTPRVYLNLNFSMAPGELRVVIGPNGAGKTTFLDLITGKTKPTTGQIGRAHV